MNEFMWFLIGCVVGFSVGGFLIVALASRWSRP